MIINLNSGYYGGTIGFPEFTYTGEYKMLDDGDNNWRIKFLSSGTLTFQMLKGAVNGIDVFLVGGGGKGAYGGWQTNHGGGGGGGYTVTSKGLTVSSGSSYDIVVGNGGEDTSAFEITAKCGEPGKEAASASDGGHVPGAGGAGGSGGGMGGNDGGSDGSNGLGDLGGQGQGTSTREFGEETGDLYAGGGGGGGHLGGAGGGGNGGDGDEDGFDLTPGEPNTGGGGAGAPSTATGYGSDGGSGIVIIRNARK